MSTDDTTVFFYGLFMDEALLVSKGITPGHVATGFVDGYALHIGERATLLPEPDGRAYGVLVHMDQCEACALYSEPTVADYVAENVVVTLPDAMQVSAVCYNLPAEKLSGANPEYAAALHKLAAELGLPAPYLEHIERIGCLGSE